MKKKTLRKLLKAQRKQREQATDYIMPAAFKERLEKLFLADPGRFAGDPREFAWRQLRESTEAKRRRAG